MLTIFLVLLPLELGSCTTVGTTLTNINLYHHVTLLEQKVAALETKDHDRELAMTSLKSQVASANNRIQQLETKLSTDEAEITILKYTTGSIPKTSVDVASLKEAVSRLQFNVSTSGVGSNANAAILSQISGLKQNISTLQAARVNTPAIGNIISHVTLLEQKVAALETKDHDRELAITSLKSQVASFNNRIQQLETKMSSAEAEIAVLKYIAGSKPQPTQTSPDLASVKTDVQILKRDVTRLQFNMSALGGGSNVGAILSELSGLKQNISTLQAVRVNTTGKATFVRWGRNDCPIGNDVVYRGYVGGKHYHELGSGTNYLCMSDSPIYGTHYSLTYSRIYGTEYQRSIFSTVKNGDDVPCVVCQSQTRSNSLMVPARNQCFSGWKLEYTGVVMAAGYNNYATQYICVDDKPQATVGGQGVSLQGLLNPVSSMCGVLECPPYTNGLVIPCAVCTN